MLCPDSTEGQVVQQQQPSEEIKEQEKVKTKKTKKVPAEGSPDPTVPNLELNSYKNPKTWKKSITKFFRNQSRSTRSNEGERPTGSKEKFEEKDINPEQKGQSLGKMFRRQSFVEHWTKSTNKGECSSPNKRLAVKKVISSYFGNKN